MEADLKNHLLALATLYCETKKRELSTVARLATGDWRYFDRIRDGATFTARKYDEIVQWFSANWPDDAEWPAGLDRPHTAPAQDAA